MPSLSSARVALFVLVAIAFSVATLPSAATAADSAADSASASSATASGTAAAAAPAAPDVAPAPPAPAVAADAPIVGHWCNAFPHVVIAIDATGRVEMDGEGRHMCELLTGAREVRNTVQKMQLHSPKVDLLLPVFWPFAVPGIHYECPIRAETFESKPINISFHAGTLHIPPHGGARSLVQAQAWRRQQGTRRSAANAGASAQTRMMT